MKPGGPKADKAQTSSNTSVQTASLTWLPAMLCPIIDKTRHASDMRKTTNNNWISSYVFRNEIATC